MQLAKFIYSAANEHNTSLGNNDAFPKRDDVSYEYVILKRRFNKIVEEVKKLFGEIPSVSDAETMLGKLIAKARRIEEPLRPQLEKMCEATVVHALSVPQETVIVECSIVSRIEPENGIRILPEYSDDDSYSYDFSDVDEVYMANKAILKRRLINALVQGASYWMMLDSFDSDKLHEWSDELPNIYMKIIALNDYLLYTKKEKISDKNPMLGAYVETHLGNGDEKTVIKSQGLVYPLLLQETFRGFFELFASHGLPNDTEKAMYIIRHADFIVAEAWDLRIGAPLWEDFERCFNKGVEESMYPYIFSSIVQLPIDEFNNTLQNIFTHTKKGKRYISDIVDDVKHDEEYNLFKKDIERFNLEKCLINDGEYDGENYVLHEKTNSQQ